MSLPRLLVILLGLLSGLAGKAQHYSLDSLRAIYCEAKDEKTYEKALNFFSNQLDSSPSNELSARYLLVKGFHTTMIGYLGHYDSAVKILRPLKNLPVKADDDYIEAWADCMYALGRWYLYTGENDSSIYFMKLSLNARLHVNKPYWRTLADNQSFLGYLYNSVLRYHEVAQTYYMKEGEILHQYNAPDYMMMVYYSNLATTFSKFDGQKSINMNIKALTYEEGDVKSQALKASILGNIANAYYRMAAGNSKEEREFLYKKSLRYQKRCVTLLNKLGFVEDALIPYMVMTKTFEHLGLRDSAWFTAIQALNICGKAGREHALVCARCYLHKGLLIDQPERAIPMLRDGIKRVVQFSPQGSNEITDAFQMVGRWFEKHNILDSALIYYHRSLTGKWKVDDVLSKPNMGSGDISKDFQVNISDKAQLLFEIGRRDQSEKHLKSSIEHYYWVEELYDQIIAESGSEQEQLNRIHKVKWQYDNAVKAAFNLYENFNGDLETVWHFIEKSKGAVNLYQTTQLNTSATGPISQEAIRQKKILTGETKRIYDLLELEGADQDSLRLALYDLNLKIDSLNDSGPEAGKLRVEATADPTTQLKDITESLLESPKECLLQFHFTDSLLFVIMIAEDRQVVKRFNKSVLESAEKHANNLKICLLKGINTDEKHYGYRQFTESASGLYELLLSDLGLEQYDEIIVIPDGFINGLPLEVLLTHEIPRNNRPDFRNLPYLIKSARISYGFSASWLIHAKQWETKLSKRKPSLLAVAYADRGRSEAQERVGLPGSLKEVEALKVTWGSDFQMLKGEAASEKELKNEASQYEVLHLATHNEVDLENPLKSGIVFRTDQDPDNDGILHSYEVYQMESKAGMVVLSACESGLGKFQSGEGFLGVSRAFGQTGTPYIVNSLWKTSDVFSIHLMKEFYGNFKTGTSPANALYKAKLKFIERGDELSAHPSYWSSYILLGNSSNAIRGRALGSPTLMLVLGGGALLLVGLIVYLKK